MPPIQQGDDRWLVDFSGIYLFLTIFLHLNLKTANLLPFCAILTVKLPNFDHFTAKMHIFDQFRSIFSLKCHFFNILPHFCCYFDSLLTTF